MVKLHRSRNTSIAWMPLTMGFSQTTWDLQPLLWGYHEPKLVPWHDLFGTFRGLGMHKFLPCYWPLRSIFRPHLLRTTAYIEDAYLGACGTRSTQVSLRKFFCLNSWILWASTVRFASKLARQFPPPYVSGTTTTAFLLHALRMSALEKACPAAAKALYNGEGDRQSWTWNLWWCGTTWGHAR